MHKSKSSVRKVPLSDDIVDILRSHKERIEKMILDGNNQFINCKLIFPNRNGSFFSSTTLRDRWKDVKSRAGISKNVTFHGIRHSFTTFQLQNNTDIKSIQAILGHSKLSTTVTYTLMQTKHHKEKLFLKSLIYCKIRRMRTK